MLSLSSGSFWININLFCFIWIRRPPSSSIGVVFCCLTCFDPKIKHYFSTKAFWIYISMHSVLSVYDITLFIYKCFGIYPYSVGYWCMGITSSVKHDECGKTEAKWTTFLLTMDGGMNIIRYDERSFNVLSRLCIMLRWCSCLCSTYNFSSLF